MRRQSFLVTGRRQHANEIELRIGRHQISGAMLADTEPIDLLDRPRSIRKKRLPALLGSGDLLRIPSASQARPSAWRAM
jgi:hypothetical protein